MWSLVWGLLLFLLRAMSCGVGAVNGIVVASLHP